MRIRVELASASLEWRFRGTESLGAWIGAAPWLDKPSIEIVRIADDDAADAVIAAIQEECWLVGRHGGTVDIGIVDPAVAAASGPSTAIAKLLGFEAEQPAIELATAVGTEAAAKPTVFVFPPIPGARPGFRAELERFIELVTKAEPLARCVVVCLDTPRAPMGGRCHDLVDGLVPPPTDVLSATEPRAWSVYRHHRMAWETGGRIAESLRLESELAAHDVPVGADDLLETLLTASAQRRLAILSPESRSAAEAGVAACVDRSEAVGKLDSDHFWSPTETQGRLPRPWVARAMLAGDPTHAHAPFLRNCLVCLPISHALLGACSVFETQIRGRIRLPSARSVPSDRSDPWTEFQTAGSLFRTLFPSSGPSVPTSPWEFATLGECLSHEVIKDRHGAWRHDVRIVRNHLAHGQYAGWFAIQLVRRLANRVATG